MKNQSLTTPYTYLTVLVLIIGVDTLMLGFQILKQEQKTVKAL